VSLCQPMASLSSEAGSSGLDCSSFVPASRRGLKECSVLFDLPLFDLARRLTSSVADLLSVLLPSMISRCL